MLQRPLFPADNDAPPARAAAQARNPWPRWWAARPQCMHALVPSRRRRHGHRRCVCVARPGFQVQMTTRRHLISARPGPVWAETGRRDESNRPGGPGLAPRACLGRRRIANYASPAGLFPVLRPWPRQVQPRPQPRRQHRDRDKQAVSGLPLPRWHLTATLVRHLLLR